MASVLVVDDIAMFCNKCCVLYCNVWYCHTSRQRIEVDGSWFELLDTIDPIDTL